MSKPVEQVQTEVLSLVSELEKMMSEPDEKDAAGINNHLRNAWWLRDALNDYFNNVCDLSKVKR